MRQTGLGAAASVALAFLAGQHHALMMLLMAGSAAGAMQSVPLLRRAMLLASLVMAGITVYRAWRHRRPLVVRALGGVSALLTLGLVGWSVAQSGF